MAELSYAQVSAVLKYDSETGRLFWKERPLSLFNDRKGKARANWLRWNKVYAGKEAFTALTTQGYKHGGIFWKLYRAHRIAWLLHYGEWPSGDIDHLNGDPADNRITNLNDGSTTDNMLNQRRYKNNKSGMGGVAWHSRDKKWAVYANIGGKRRSLGYFLHKDDAIAARRKANNEMGFSGRHGL